MLITFVDSDRNRKFSFDGVRRIKVHVYAKDVYIDGLDSVTNETYSVRVNAADYSYFTVNKEDKEDE